MTTSKRRIRVAIVGATGLAGQQFIAALSAHPQFEITALAASIRSSGKTYRDAIRNDNGAIQWFASVALPERIAAMTVEDAEKLDATKVDLVFTAVEEIGRAHV